jgi:hypothetical protein
MTDKLPRPIQQSDLNAKLQGSVLEKDGMRLLWDAFYNNELCRAQLISNYFQLHNINSDSLEYFNSEMMGNLCVMLTQPTSNESNEAILAWSQSCFSIDQLIKFIIESISLDLHVGLSSYINCIDNLVSFTTGPSEQICIFVERVGTFCEFPCLAAISTSLDATKVTNFKADCARLKQEVLLFISQKLHESISLLDGETMSLIQRIGLEKCDLESISDKFNALKVKSSSEQLRQSISDTIDRIMKCIQTSLRAADTATIVIDPAVSDKVNKTCKLLSESSFAAGSTEFNTLLSKFNQIILNKTNIISTIHINELSAANKNRQLQLPVPSKLYIAVRVCDQFKAACNTSNDSELVNTACNTSNGSELIRAFAEYIDENISQKMYSLWTMSIEAAFVDIFAQQGQFMALFWLSSVFASLHVSDEQQKGEILSQLHIDKAILQEQYRKQASLLNGLFDSKLPLLAQNTPPSPPSLPSTPLLPHFNAK